MANLDSVEIEALLDALNSGDDTRAEAAVARLAEAGGSQDADLLGKLREMAASPEVDTRWWAVRLLAAIKNPDVVVDLTAALRDPDPMIRQCAAVGLRHYRDPRSVESLIGALYDEDHLVAEAAMAALVETGEPAVPCLIDLVSSASPQARLLAVKALAKIGDPKAIPALLMASESHSAVLDFWIEEGLDKMGIGMVYFKA